VGAVTKLDHVLDFSDLMILCMAFPNILGGAILAPRVKAALRSYQEQLRSGEFAPWRDASAGRQTKAG
jgi:AGCS family alanine or glycine:cation symporter